MATLATYAATPDMRGYTSTRVFDGVRQLDDRQSAAHRERLKKALAKRSGTRNAAEV